TLLSRDSEFCWKEAPLAAGWAWGLVSEAGCSRCSAREVQHFGCFIHLSSVTSSCPCSERWVPSERLAMNSTILTKALEIAGVLHLGLICAGLSMPKAVDLRRHLVGLPCFVRRLFLVYYSFIGLMLVGFGTLTVLFAPQMATGEPIARGLCILL